jgi:hypothetical protein
MSSFWQSSDGVCCSIQLSDISGSVNSGTNIRIIHLQRNGSVALRDDTVQLSHQVLTNLNSGKHSTLQDHRHAMSAFLNPSFRYLHFFCCLFYYWLLILPSFQFLSFQPNFSLYFLLTSFFLLLLFLSFILSSFNILFMFYISLFICFCFLSFFYRH